MTSAISAGALVSLATKLDGLDLNDAEQSILDEIFARAADEEAEVSGFLLLPAVQAAISDHDLDDRVSRLVINLSVGWDAR